MNKVKIFFWTPPDRNEWYWYLIEKFYVEKEAKWLYKRRKLKRKYD